MKPRGKGQFSSESHGTPDAQAESQLGVYEEAPRGSTTPNEVSGYNDTDRASDSGHPKRQQHNGDGNERDGG